MRNVQTHTKIHLNTGGMVESLKVITGDNVPCQHMHLISRWLKIRTINFSFILPRNIDHVLFDVVALKILIILPQIQIFFEFWAISKRTFSSLKMSHLDKQHVINISSRNWRKNEWFEFWATWKSDAYTGTGHWFVDFLSHLSEMISLSLPYY